MTTIKAQFTVNLEQAVKDELDADFSKSIQEEVDFSLVCDLLVGLGWTNVVVHRFSRLLNAEDGTNVRTWLEKNCQGKYEGRFERYVFELAQDATAFSLKWA